MKTTKILWTILTLAHNTPMLPKVYLSTINRSTQQGAKHNRLESCCSTSHNILSHGNSHCRLDTHRPLLLPLPPRRRCSAGRVLGHLRSGGGEPRPLHSVRQGCGSGTLGGVLWRHQNPQWHGHDDFGPKDGVQLHQEHHSQDSWFQPFTCFLPSGEMRCLRPLPHQPICQLQRDLLKLEVHHAWCDLRWLVYEL